jgi:hypothetical protein
MADTATYDLIASQTLASAASSITFSSIAASWTDLRLIIVLTGTASGDSPWVRYNSDSGTNYSLTDMMGSGSIVVNNAYTNSNKLFIGDNASTNTTNPHFYTLDIFSYAGSTYKTSLSTASADDNGSGYAERAVGLWRSTSAINSLTISTNTNTFKTGTTAQLYGIKSA